MASKEKKDNENNDIGKELAIFVSELDTFLARWEFADSHPLIGTFVRSFQTQHIFASILTKTLQEDITTEHQWCAEAHVAILDSASKFLGKFHKPMHKFFDTYANDDLKEAESETNETEIETEKKEENPISLLQLIFEEEEEEEEEN